MSTSPAFVPAAGGDPGVPRHVAIIMDGNGRWAKQRLLPRVEGPRAGVEAVRQVTGEARALGIVALSLYGFSVETTGGQDPEVNTILTAERVHGGEGKECGEQVQLRGHR